MAVFRNLFKDIDGVFETKFENVIVVEGTDYESGYKDGYADGQNAAKEKMTVLSVTHNGTYLPQNGAIGFSKVDVSVKSSSDDNGSYEDGYKDGYQAGLSEGYVNGFAAGKIQGENEGYNNGYSEGILIGDSAGFLRGHTEGYNEALSRRTELVITENGEYTPTGDSTGFKRVSVAVTEGSGDCDCFTVTLSEDGTIEMHNPPHTHETGYDLYTVDEYGDTIGLVSSVSADSETSWNVSGYLMGGNEYVAIVKIWGYGGTLEYSSKSNTISVPVNVTLSKNGVVNAPMSSIFELELYLYDAETDTLIESIDFAIIPYDFSISMEVGKSYYVVAKNVSGLHPSFEAKSDTIVYEGKTEIWYFYEIQNWARNEIYIENNSIFSPNMLFFVRDESWNLVGEFGYEQPLDLSQLDESNPYFIYPEETSEDPIATLKYGIPPEPVWLFENEILTNSPRYDLPEPEVGVSYTLFVNGEEIATATADEWGISLYSDDYTVWVNYDDSMESRCGWYFHPIESEGMSGTVSIRING